MRILFAGLITLFVFSITGHASDLTDLGPGIGSVIPHDLSVKDSDGNPQSFQSLKGEKGAVVVFYRSAKWCPFCQRQLIGINKIAGDIQAQGYELIGVSYDKQRQLSKFKKRRKISYALLADEESEIIKAFDLLNPEYKPGHYAHGVPYPLIAVVDQDGVIKAKLYEQSYKDRPENDLILETLAGLPAE